ncbi:membrane transporter [Fusarium austroafricanum]|uniref:Membrane transporter n=1 Tax=Fusarium austroafricanum TaxID=2364996 RepID=A0A8H4KUZ3_9HYPO|nr:membrane transporter [Fusarium austroafricanum]
MRGDKGLDFKSMNHNKGSTTKETNDIILHPQPSDDPADPLNWRPSRRNASIVINTFWCTMMQAAQTWTGPAFAIWNMELGIGMNDLNNGVAILVFMCGVGIMFMQPWALKFGRRAPYMAGSALMLAALSFGATMSSSGFYYAFCILAGFGASPSFCVTETSLLDVTFLHQRGRVLSLYSLAVGTGTFLSPVAAGYIIQGQGWRWCFYYLLLFVGLAAFLVALGSPETLFVRETPGVPSEPDTAIGTVQDDNDNATKPVSEQIPAVKRSSSFPTEGPAAESSAFARHSSSLTLFRRDTTIMASFFWLTYSPFKLLQLPAVTWMTLMLSIQSFWVNLIITTQAAFFAAPPYNFDSSQLGLMNLAMFIGILIGCVWGGPLTDTLIIYKSRQRNGISEAEDRLWMYTVVPIGIAGGVLLWGVGASYGIPWIGPCIGLALLGFSIAALLPISQGYALDSYPELAGGIIQVSNVLRNVIGGALSFAITPWINHSGAKNASIAIAMLGMFLNSLFVIFLWKGKELRRGTKESYLRLILDQV